MVGYVQKWQVEPTIYWKMWVAIKVQPRLRIPGFNLSLRTENLQVGFSGGTQVGQCPTWVCGFRCRSPWVCQRMRTHSDRVITAGLVRSVISTLGS